MSQPFNPQPHLIQLPRKVKDKATGHYITVYDDYLEVKWRLCWFRDRYPHGTIETEELCVDLDRGYARYKARVTDGEGGSATGHGTETKADFADYCERAETRALGRALAAMGIGTQFVGAELDELPHVADTPVTPIAAPDAAHETSGMSQPLHVGEGGTPGAATPPATNGPRPVPEPEARMTDEAIAVLFHLALERCGDEKEAFGTRVRRAMGVSEETKINKKFVAAHLTPESYRTVYGWYETLYLQLQRKTEVSNGATPANPVVASAALSPTGEGPTASPSPAASSSAGSDPADAVDPAYHKLYQEALGWGVKASEIEHVLKHHDLGKSRALLWTARRTAPAATPIEAAAAD